MRADTDRYMAPETIVLDGRGEWRPSDSHADMWSLGELSLPGSYTFKQLLCVHEGEGLAA
jgi:hypothetical protein